MKEGLRKQPIVNECYREFIEYTGIDEEQFDFDDFVDCLDPHNFWCNHWTDSANSFWEGYRRAKGLLTANVETSDFRASPEEKKLSTARDYLKTIIENTHDAEIEKLAQKCLEKIK